MTISVLHTNLEEGWLGSPMPFLFKIFHGVAVRWQLELGCLEYLFTHLTIWLGRLRQLRAGIVGTAQASLSLRGLSTGQTQTSYMVAKGSQSQTPRVTHRNPMAFSKLVIGNPLLRSPHWCSYKDLPKFKERLQRLHYLVEGVSKNLQRCFQTSPVWSCRALRGPYFRGGPDADDPHQMPLPHPTRTQGSLGTRADWGTKRRARGVESILNWLNLNPELIMFTSVSYWECWLGTLSF